MPPLLEFREVSKSFRARGGLVHAVRQVSLTVEAGETLAVVGESGSGKTTLGRLALALLAPDSGQVLFQQADWALLPAAAARRQRAGLQVIFQDPDTSLNPRLRAGQIVTEPLFIHGRLHGPLWQRHARQEHAAAGLLEMVGLDPSWRHRFPHECSGGQRQRLAIARAISLRPELIVADEPLASLDVSTAAQIMTLLRHLKVDLGVSYLFISHHLGWVRQIADRVAVAREGQIVECGGAEQILSHPSQVYTRQLLAATPRLPPVLAGRPAPS